MQHSENRSLVKLCLDRPTGYYIGVYTPDKSPERGYWIRDDIKTEYVVSPPRGLENYHKLELLYKRCDRFLDNFKLERIARELTRHPVLNHSPNESPGDGSGVHVNGQHNEKLPKDTIDSLVARAMTLLRDF